MDTDGSCTTGPCFEPRDRDLPKRATSPDALHHDPFGIVGTILDGRYLVERVVGAGGFGIAYRALHLQFDSPVAIKVLRLPDSVPSDRRDEFMAGFSAEGKVLFRLGSLHPAIVRALETGSFPMADGRVVPYLVMEWLDGRGLAEELQARKNKKLPPLSLEEALTLLHPIADALSVAHEQGIAHRDVKPHNVFLSISSRGTVAARLLDFGLAKVMAHGASVTERLEDTSGGETPFTPAYGAPEQWLRRLGATGTWTDVYGLALMLVEILAGRAALDGNDRGQLMGACLDASTRPTPRTLGLDVPDAVERVFVRALAVNPRERYLSVGRMWTDLTAAAGRSPRSQGGQTRGLESIRGTSLEGPETRTLSSVRAAPLSDPSRNATAAMAVEGHRVIRGVARLQGGPFRAALTVTAAVVLVVSLGLRRATESDDGSRTDRFAEVSLPTAPSATAGSTAPIDPKTPAPTIEASSALVSASATVATAVPKRGTASPPVASNVPPHNPPPTGRPTGLVQDEALLDRK